MRNNITLYITVIAPTTLYGVAMWSHAAKTHRKKIQVIQNKILKTIVKAPWYVRNTTLRRDFEIPTIEDMLREPTSSTLALAETHYNRLVKEAVNYKTTIDSSLNTIPTPGTRLVYSNCR